jgi:hypothetical protein
VDLIVPGAMLASRGVTPDNDGVVFFRSRQSGRTAQADRRDPRAKIQLRLSATSPCSPEDNGPA